MNAFTAVALAIVKGFVRDKMSVFFAIVFPLMFLVLFGGIFNYSSSPRIELVQIGPVPVFDTLPAGAARALGQTFDITHSRDPAAAIATVRKGDADVAVQMRGATLIAHYTQTDPTKAAVTRGTLNAFVNSANIAATGQPPRFTLRTEPVEDRSLQTIQFVTPGLLGWAVAMSAAFGAAATLQGWRHSKLLRRLQLSPIPTGTVTTTRAPTTGGNRAGADGGSSSDSGWRRSG